MLIVIETEFKLQLEKGGCMKVLAVLMVLSVLGVASAEEVKKIEDNSFLIEEASNQEPSMVQHIQTFQYMKDKTWAYTRYLILAHEQELYNHRSMLNYKPLLDYYWGHPLTRFAHLLNRGNVSASI